MSKEPCKADSRVYNKIIRRELKGDLVKSTDGIDELVLPLSGLSPSLALQRKEHIPPRTGRHGIFLWIIFVPAVDMMPTLNLLPFSFSNRESCGGL